jgi:uncharacterized membrane protein
VLALYYAEGLNQGKFPYVPEKPVPDDHQVEYPVLTGLFMGLIGLPVHAAGERNPQLNQGEVFYDLNALALSAFAVATVAMIISMRRRRPWDAALFALSPALLVTATVNWDFLAIVLAIGALYFWAKDWVPAPLLTGLLLGLGASAKLWPAFLLGPLIVLAIRKRDYMRMALAVGAAVVTWLIVNVPVMAISFHDWSKFWRLSEDRAIDWGTIWYVGRYFDGDVFHGVMPQFWANTPLVTLLANVLFVIGCAGVAVLAIIAPKTPRLAQLAFLVIAIFLVTSKVWSQQFNLWLLPLVVLARPKWGAFIAWQVAEVAYFLAFYGELMGASGQPVIPEGTFIFASILRLATVIALIVLVVREVLHPELDVVRATYRGDPDWPAQSLKMTASWRSSRWIPRPSTDVVRGALVGGAHDLFAKHHNAFHPELAQQVDAARVGEGHGGVAHALCRQRYEAAAAVDDRLEVLGEPHHHVLVAERVARQHQHRRLRGGQ